MKNTIVGVDLAKNVIQVCVTKANTVISNKEMTPEQLTSWLTTTESAIIVFEACVTSNYWKQVATSKGHDARIISAKLVSQIRQNQKTDRNDALAIVQASQLVDVQFIQGKTFAQQELQSIMRMRELAIKQKVAFRHQIEALLLEFNIRPSSKKGGLGGMIESVLEDAENGFSIQFRHSLATSWKLYTQVLKSIDEHEKRLAQVIKAHPECQKLLALEGVSNINAINLYIALSCGDAGTFHTGRDASACIGLTPIQHSSGGKTKVGSIGKRVKNIALRSYLVSGAMSVVIQVAKRKPRTKKESWLKQLIERRGKKCAAVALANKTVRTAFAMLMQGTCYKAEPLKA